MAKDTSSTETVNFGNLTLKGAIVLTSFIDQFEFYPESCLGGGGTLQVQSGLDLGKPAMSIHDRTKVFRLKYDHDSYDGKIFCRVTIGKYFLKLKWRPLNIFRGLII